MNPSHQGSEAKTSVPYLSAPGAWAFSFGCSVGWGSFVMPGTTFLPIAGPVGTAVGIGIGAIVMILLAANYHYLMNRFSSEGGVYSYTKYCFGCDHGLISAWFLILIYIAIIWANATALPLIMRTVLGSTFQFGFHYEIAGYQVFLGEILLSVGALLTAGLLCFRRKLAEHTQIVMALILFFFVVICYIAAMRNRPAHLPVFSPPFAPSHSTMGGIFTIFALAPWAYVGFESISHSTEEAAFPLKKTFRILFIAVICSAAAYILLSLLAAVYLPEGCSSWIEYVGALGEYSGISSQPTFFSAYSAMGKAGTVLLGMAALCAIFTGLIGNYTALSRLLAVMSEDGLLPASFHRKSRNNVPVYAVILIFAISALLPFFGRTAISWIVDVTTVGATIAYAYASAAVWKTALKEHKKLYIATGLSGLIVAVLFALEFLIPNLIDVKTLSVESYFILAAWGILGFLYFWYVFRKDKTGQYGRSTAVWIIFLALIIYASSVWMTQETNRAVDQSVEPIRSYYTEQFLDEGIPAAEEPGPAYLIEVLYKVKEAHIISMVMQITLIVTALLILFDIYRRIHMREKQMEIEKALAEETSKAKTSFLSNMSHEIRTPMNAIIGLDNIALRNPDLSPQTREQLEKIGASAKHLLGLINDILDMSRIESGRMPLKNEEFSFSGFLEQINIIISGQCVDKGLDYDCQIIGHVSDYYFGDDLKLKQVLINILGNSVKFTDAPGSVSLTVEEKNQFEGLCTLCFVIKDTGIGMDKEFIPRLFESFSQEDSSSTNRYGGSGLGMALTRNYVEMMNGDIEVQSEKGVGSVFTVTVTLNSSSRSVKIGQETSLPSPFRALAVDDDEISCAHVQLVLRAIGIEADMATDAGKALSLLKDAFDRGEPYQLLLTDYRMPQMTGIELAREVRAFDNGSTAIIILTGYSWDNIEKEASEYGIDSIMSKPLFSDTLVRELHNIQIRRSGENQSSQQILSPSLQNLEGCRVLMAEDVEQNAEILEDLLELEGIAGEHAENGSVAVRMFSEKPEGYYDAILMDVRMPVMDGLAATRSIRAMDRPDAKKIPIIAMTANVFDEDVMHSLQAGMNAHLSKPVEPEHLYDTLDRLIAEYRKGQSMSEGQSP